MILSRLLLFICIDRSETWGPIFVSLITLMGILDLHTILPRSRGPAHLSIQTGSSRCVPLQVSNLLETSQPYSQEDEFAWVDSAYSLGSRTIPVHKRPAADIRENRIFDKAVAHLRVRSEHCMGALKGRFQCLRGLRVNINSPQDHIQAGRWMTVCVILHNLVIDVEGDATHEWGGG